MAARKLALALVALCLTAAALQAPVVSAATWHVSGDAGTDQAGCGVEPGTAACKTLDYAIDLAAAGDTVTAAHGKYGITQVLEKSITITGEGRCVVFVSSHAASVLCHATQRHSGTRTALTCVYTARGGAAATGSTPSSHARQAEL